MSVINQMLKDLDKRNAEDNLATNESTVIIRNATSRKPIFLAIGLTVLVTLSLAFAYQQYSENQSLKSQRNQQAVFEKKPADIDVNAYKNEISDSAIQTAKNKAGKKTENKAEQKVISSSQELAQATSVPVQAQESFVDNVKIESATTLEKPSEAPLKTTADQAKPRPKRESDEVVQIAPEKAPPPTKKLVIARKQLSPKELAAQKMKQAEKAVFNKDVAQAQTLLQDVLLLTPENKAARQQLAALWYGEKSYQAAINLLAQGIYLTPNDVDFRLMSAKIYLAQQQTQAAFDVLIPLSAVQQVDYQSLLASTSQSLNLNESAITAYQTLIVLQPSKSRWYLGLAIALDSDGEFNAALASYQKALSAGDLSSDSRAFIKQRIQALGE